METPVNFFWACQWNSMMRLFKWRLFGSTFLWYRLYFNILYSFLGVKWLNHWSLKVSFYDWLSVQSTATLPHCHRLYFNILYSFLGVKWLNHWTLKVSFYDWLSEQSTATLQMPCYNRIYISWRIGERDLFTEDNSWYYGLSQSQTPNGCPNGIFHIVLWGLSKFALLLSCNVTTSIWKNLMLSLIQS